LKAAVETHDFARFAAADAVSDLIGPAVLFEMRQITFQIHVRKADTVAAGIVVRDFEIGPRKCGQIAVGRAIDERFGVDRFSAGPAVNYGASHAAAIHDRAGQQRVDGDKDPGFIEHLHGDQLVHFGIDRGAHRVVIVSPEHLGVSRTGAGGYHVIDDLAGNPAHDLTLLDAGEGLPQIVKAVKRRTALGDGSAGIALPFDQHGLGALPSGRQCCYDPARSGADNDDVELPDREFLRRLLIKLTGLTPDAGPACFRQAGKSANSEQHAIF